MAAIIRMPEVLAGATEAALEAWLVTPGDEIRVGQPIAEVETEKAVVEYEAEQGGVLAGLLVETGVQVSVGTPIAVLAEPGESIEDAMAAAGGSAADSEAEGEPATGPAGTVAAPERETTPQQVKAPEVDRIPTVNAPQGNRVSDIAPAHTRQFISPLVRRLAAQRGLDLSATTGSGPGGRIVRRDIDGIPAAEADMPALASRAEQASEVAAGVGYTDIPHTGMRRAIARRLVESVTTMPHFYLVADCRVDELLAIRRSVNQLSAAPISVNDFVVKAVGAAFSDVPEANAIWMNGALRRFDDVSIAIAVSVEGGLVTPVMETVNRRSISDLSAGIRDLAERGRAGRLKQHELEGGSFSVSNLGMFGTEKFSAIINPPHSGILAVGAATQRPVVTDGEIAVATVMTVTLSADHRVLDGALAAKWLAAFKTRIENPLGLLI
ncbi:dihydrolipoamide acetyltransferase family protein [Arthrobacter sp. TB 23]|uniref:dihydrolipoamide acetyltransferase family protein n=1 Tax=Arthrobacter sp. TB 23 TaxID=494419 RepID=UPI0002E9156D|nr:dihydrolipoamide acetyltransferase family protein [Arthrobacter sp. TB 23]